MFFHPYLCTECGKLDDGCICSDWQYEIGLSEELEQAMNERLDDDLFNLGGI